MTGKFVENVDLYEDNVFTINKTKFVKDLPVKEIKTFKQQQIEKNTRNYVQHIGKEMDESINRELYDYLLWNYKFEVAQDQYRLKPETEERELKLTYIKKCLSQCFMNNIQFESINVQESHNVYIRNHKTSAELYQEREMLVREWIETNETLDIELPT